MFSMTALMYERTRDLYGPEREGRDRPISRDRAGWLGWWRHWLATVLFRRVALEPAAAGPAAPGPAARQVGAAALFFGRRT